MPQRTQRLFCANVGEIFIIHSLRLLHIFSAILTPGRLHCLSSRKRIIIRL
nr:MAG TPA: hypothetical protein [Caudoviricetes sp.]